MFFSSINEINRLLKEIKTKRNRRWKIPHTILERWTLCFSPYKNCKLKLNLWWVGTRERKKEECNFCNVYFVRRNFFNICVLSQCTVYWRKFQNTYIFTYQKNYYILFFNRDLNRGCLASMFSLRLSGSKFLINLQPQFRVRKNFSCA